MNKKNIFIACFILIFFGTAFIQYKNTLPQKKVSSPLLILVNQSVSVADKKSLSPIRIKVGSTALQLLKSTHTVLTKGEKENAFVTSIDGKNASADEKEFWAFYVNGEQAQVGAGSYFMKNNDTIEWKIETY